MRYHSTSIKMAQNQMLIMKKAFIYEGRSYIRTLSTFLPFFSVNIKLKKKKSLSKRGRKR